MVNARFTFFRQHWHPAIAEAQNTVQRPRAITTDPNRRVDNTKDLQINWLYKKIEYFTEIEKALILLYLEDKKYTEIGETLGISQVNARVKISRLKRKLKAML
jgi:RNA polymerase sigma factor (sigma-70 family)